MSVTRVRVLAIALGCASVLLTGCNATGSPTPQSQRPMGSGPHAPAHTAPVASVTSNVARGATGVPVDHRVQVSADHARLSSVTVSSTSGSVPAQRGSWHWISDTEVHWRPATYWKAGTHVTVSADINSVPAGNGIYGQLDRQIQFNVGAAHIYKVDAKTDEMHVFSNGRLLRTVPVTTGKPGFVTRSGVKVIIEKDRHKRMNSETIGIDPNGPNGYNIGDVQFAMRVTYSGEFLHAAPWSVAYQGISNVSHGCTGMSTSNADWLYHMSRRGDVVVTTGTDRGMTLTNGYGDWNESFADYAKGSALH
jgi:lipoprotein-anchoring transpeptidase ErfK/SrfK